MDEREQAKQRYIEAAALQSKETGEGHYRAANRHVKVIFGIEDKVREGSIDKDMLVELLAHENIAVSSSAAAGLLRLGHEIKLSEQTLERIAAIDDTDRSLGEKLVVTNAEFGLRLWREKGNLD
jgi:hypothetical protein